MPDVELKREKRHWRTRFNYAAEAIKSSTVIKVFGAASLIEIFDYVFKLREGLTKLGYWNDEADHSWKVIYSVIVILFLELYF